MILFLCGWSENGPWGTPKNNVSELGSAFSFFFKIKSKMRFKKTQVNRSQIKTKPDG
jgi:hypothetical protein